MQYVAVSRQYHQIRSRSMKKDWDRDINDGWRVPRGSQGRLGFAGTWLFADRVYLKFPRQTYIYRFSDGVLLDGGMLDVDNETRTIDDVGWWVWMKMRYPKSTAESSLSPLNWCFWGYTNFQNITDPSRLTVALIWQQKALRKRLHNWNDLRRTREEAGGWERYEPSLRRSADQPQLHCLICATIRQAQIRLLHSDPKMGLAVVWDPRVGVARLWELHETTVSKWS